jgi:hypothetical protein
MAVIRYGKAKEPSMLAYRCGASKIWIVGRGVEG